MIGENIRNIREIKGLKLNETARKANISGAYLSDIENGKKKNPGMEVLEKIARALEVQVKDLLTEEDTKIEEAIDLGIETSEVAPVYIAFAKEMQDNDLSPEQIEKLRQLMKVLFKE